jgi:outer membrane biosynthesis protein TonB
MRMSFELRFQVPGQAPQVVPLNESRMLVGTLLSNHVVLRATDVEPIHAMIEEVDGQWVITDLGSGSGVRANGQIIPVEMRLNKGDQIQIGAVTLTVHLIAEETFAAAPIAPPAMAEGFGDGSAKRMLSPSSTESTAGTGKMTVGRKTESRASQSESDSERRVERKDVLFSPRHARPSGSVLECVAYWGDTVLDVELFHPKFKGFERVSIGDPTKAHFISAGDDDISKHVLAEVREDGYKLNLLPGMEARFRKGGQVESHEGGGSHRLGRRDIAHIKLGAVRYFLLFCNPPSVDLPRNGPRDPFFMGLSLLATIAYFGLMIPIILSDKPDEIDMLSDDQIAIINVPIKEPPKPVIEKPKVDLVEVKKEPETPPVPKPQPQKPEPVKPTQQEAPKPPKPVEQKAEVKKEAVKPLTENKKPAAPAAPANPLEALSKAGEGMPSTGAKEPDFKLAGKDTGGPKGASGGPRGGGNNQAGAARKGNEKSNVYGVEGANNNKASGVNLSKLGLGVGKVLSQTGPGAIQTDFKSSVGGAGGGSGSAAKTYGIGGGDGRRQSLGLGGGSGANNFGAGGSGGYLSGEGGKGGLGGSGLGRGTGGRPRPDVQLPAEDPVVGGGLTQQEVLAVIRANLNQIRHCYEQLLQRSPSAQGKLSTQFVIGLDGRVKSARIESGTITDSIMQGCVTSRIQRWKFPNPRGGTDVSVVYPFVFTPL